MAICQSVNNILNDDSSLVGAEGSEIGMIIDNGGDEEGGDTGTPSVRRMKKVTDFLAPLVNFTQDHIRDITDEIESAREKKTQLSHFEADLNEGKKYMIRSVTLHVTAALKQDETIKATAELGGSSLEVENWVSKCSFLQGILE